FGLHQIPQALCPQAGQCVLNLNRAAQSQHVGIRIRPRNPVPPWIAAPVTDGQMHLAVSVGFVCLTVCSVASVCFHVAAPTFESLQTAERRAEPLLTNHYSLPTSFISDQTLLAESSLR